MHIEKSIIHGIILYLVTSCSTFDHAERKSMVIKKMSDGREVEVDFGNKLCSNPDFVGTKIPELHAKQKKNDLVDPIFKAVIEYEIPLVKFSYNPSIVEDNDGYLMTFRFDCTSRSHTDTQSYTLIHEMSKAFAPISRLQLIGMPAFSSGKSENSIMEDMRIFKINNQLYATVSDNVDGINYNFRSRRVHFLKLKKDNEEWHADSAAFFAPPNNLPLRGTEKNWTAIPVIDNQDKEVPSFIYALDPQFMLIRAKSDKTLSGEANTEIFQKCLSPIPWEREKYGELRGGTPLVWVEELQGYIGFFHTAKVLENHRGKIYYLGAYVMNGVTQCVSHISPKPLLYPGMYDGNKGFWVHEMGPDAQVIFPTGLEKGIWDHRSVFVVSAGINDYRAKILLLDQKALLSSLIKIK